MPIIAALAAVGGSVAQTVIQSDAERKRAHEAQDILKGDVGQKLDAALQEVTDLGAKLEKKEAKVADLKNQVVAVANAAEQAVSDTQAKSKQQSLMILGGAGVLLVAMFFWLRKGK